MNEVDELMEIAKKCFFSGKREKALEIFEAITKKFKDNIDACLDYSNMLKSFDAYGDALIELERGLKINPNNFKLLCNKGFLLNDLGKFQAALPVLKDAIKYGPDDHNSWNNLGNSYYYTCDLENALKAYDKALRLKPDFSLVISNITKTISLMKSELYNDRKITGKLQDKSGIVDTLQNLGWIHQNQGNFGEAIKFYMGSLEIYDKLEDKKGVATILHQMGMSYQQLGNYTEAIKCYNRSLEIFEDIGNTRHMEATIQNLGNMHFYQGNYTESIKCYRKSLELSKKMGNKQVMAHNLHQLGCIYYQQGKLQEAANLYKLSLEIKEEIGDKKGIAHTLHQFGMINHSEGNYQEAINKYQESQKIKEEIGDKKGIASSLHQLGMIHHDQGNYLEAIKNYELSMRISEEVGDKLQNAQTLGQVGRIMENIVKDFPSALEKYLSAYKIFNDINSPDAKKAEKYLIELKEKMGDEAFNKTYDEFKRKHGS